MLCMDEKSQIQALDRTQASLPMVAGRAGTMTHDYKRNGTTTLFAALDVLTGTVIGQCLPRHRHTEFLTFLNTIDREVPNGLQVHLILDNYSHPQARRRRSMAQAAQAVSPALHPDLVVVAQPGRALVSRPDRQEPAPRHLRQRARPDRQHRGIPQRPQRRSQTLRLDSHRRIHPRQSPTRTHQTRTSSYPKLRQTTRVRRAVSARPPLPGSPTVRRCVPWRPPVLRVAGRR